MHAHRQVLQVVHVTWQRVCSLLSGSDPLSGAIMAADHTLQGLSSMRNVLPQHVFLGCALRPPGCRGPPLHNFVQRSREHWQSTGLPARASPCMRQAPPSGGHVQGPRIAGDRQSTGQPAEDILKGSDPAEHSSPCRKLHLHAENPHLLLLRNKDGVLDDLATIMLLLCKHLRRGGLGCCRRLSCTG